ncbi:MAG: putative toxin-antitoxin system toxin component, PIN family [Elusimicrobia bacterium RIFCSPLOWO2_01_FULL_54_10]|nr:MAG: putative toxin-antitoxin system toxin component, PIN family [Elusimicrobia bacterium RIFCSPLOWO2_01_FULL_54_10]
MKVVLDTNVLVSGLLVQGSVPSEILRDFRDGQWILVLSGAILEEYGRVLRRKKFDLSTANIESMLRLIENKALKVIPSEHFTIIHQDPSDNEFLDVAVECHADFIVSGDQHLLALKRFRGIPILLPSEFLKALREI